MVKPGSKPRPHPASKRERILDKAFALLGNKGFRGLSFQDLAELCELTKQGVLHYFPSKPTLLLALLDERDASVEAFLLQDLESEGFEKPQSLGERRAILQQSLVRVVEHMTATPGLIRLHVVLRAEAMEAGHPASAYFLERDRATLDWLVEKLKELSPAPVSRARQILALMLGLQQQWVQENSGFDLIALWRQSLDRLLSD